MSYYKIAPRDLFNEANFMKCIGQLTLIMHDTYLPSIKFEHDIYRDHGVTFELDEYTGGLVLHNMFVVRGERVTICRPLNSREPWPIYIESDDDYISIFTNDGVLSEEFKQWLIM